MNAQAHFDSDSRRPRKSASGLASEGGNSDRRRTQELSAGFQSKPLPQANQANCSGGVCTMGDWKPKRQA